MTMPSSTNYEDEIDLLRYGRFMASYWLLLLVCSIGGMIAAVAVGWAWPVKYQATTTLSINTTAPALSVAASRALLSNQSLVAETINELQLNRDGLTPQSFIDDALEVQIVPATNLLKVSVVLSDPTKARLAANAIAQKAVVLSHQLDRNGAITSRDVLKKQMDEAALRLDAAQARVLEFQAATHIDLLEEDIQSKLKDRDAIARLEIELQGEKARLTRIEEELSRQPKMLEATRASTDGSTSKPGAGRLIEIGSDKADPFTNPVYSMLEYEVAQSRAKMSGLEEQIRGTRGRAGPAQTKMLNTLYARRMELNRLQADADVSKHVYESLATQHEQARGRTVGVTPPLLIVDAPVQPDRPLSRAIPQFAILGGLVGLLFGVVTALVVNRRRALHGVV